jgi:hypothetical protein
MWPSSLTSRRDGQDFLSPTRERGTGCVPRSRVGLKNQHDDAGLLHIQKIHAKKRKKCLYLT